ncbi:MAG: DNA-processing protein DprA [Gemmatimonadetes bacterium]|nr:DNA-processing protein DprA [Gemmatimonadota bacterium]
MTASPDSRTRALLMLRALPALDDARRRELLERHASPAAALRAARRALAGRYEPSVIAARADRAMRSARQVGARMMGFGDADYPRRLLDLPDPPAVLFLLGDAALLERPAIAIVGTRRSTAYGCEVARALATVLARTGFTIVSGLAHGIDRCAHEAALEAGGLTAAFVGCGVDVVYPRSHHALFANIANRGLVASEFLPGTPALKHHFPRRNRLIAAVSLGVVVVEAPHASGALITSNHAIGLGREVFAVPGPIGRASSAGTNALVRDGATMVLDPHDVIETLLPQMTTDQIARLTVEGARSGTTRSEPAAQTGLAFTHDLDAQVRAQSLLRRTGMTSASLASLWKSLDVEPQHVDELARAADLTSAHALALLLEMELAGHVRQSPGLRFSRPLAA